jgi:hypothetical protein
MSDKHFDLTQIEPMTAPRFTCHARANLEDCDWPFCSRDPAANRVMEAIQECNKVIVDEGDLRHALETSRYNASPREVAARWNAMERLRKAVGLE